MTERRACPPASGPFEAYVARSDDLLAALAALAALARRRGLREYLTALLVPRDRNKTLTCLAGAKPVTGSQNAAVQRSQFLPPESTWDDALVNDRRLQLIRADLATAPHDQEVLVIEDSGDHKDGTATAHVGRLLLRRLGKTDNGIVTVTTVWTNGRIRVGLFVLAKDLALDSREVKFPQRECETAQAALELPREEPDLVAYLWSRRKAGMSARVG
ncbi:transposase [Streptomyces sp. NBC_00237]|uniref:transposase n=1 Tax=Streptomyces sp. NBC_00237 TaxID=2975687 RepID=UPI00224FE861|nr:transposase [Streptomyces sp. NBC_00237]MCX5205742.1 transposase [Streptomyces sp. NBC_00237]